MYCFSLRRFDLVNDVFGHHVGDRLLVQVVARLRSLGYFSVARLGGASFAVARAGALSPDALPEHGAALIEKLVRPYLVDGQPIIVGACLGAATTAISGREPATLLMHASMAQASAARRVGDVFELFSPDMETRRRTKQALDADLRRAVADGSLAMHFQAKVDLSSGRFIGAEALMRWRRPSGENVSPAAFVPVAEESGLIVELGRFALAPRLRRGGVMAGGQRGRGQCLAGAVRPVRRVRRRAGRAAGGQAAARAARNRDHRKRLRRRRLPPSPPRWRSCARSA